MPGARLLIVDDDEANRDILTRTLARQGYTNRRRERSRKRCECSVEVVSIWCCST